MAMIVLQFGGAVDANYAGYIVWFKLMGFGYTVIFFFLSSFQDYNDKQLQ